MCESGKPYRRPLVKYTPGYGRSYTPPSQQTRDFVARMKLIPIKEIIEGNRIVVCEDSIVRGTQLKNFTIKKLWDWIAKELEITTLRYQILEDMVKAIGLPKEKLCLYCWTGKSFE